MRIEYIYSEAGFSKASWYRLQQCSVCKMWMQIIAGFDPRDYAHYDCIVKADQTYAYDKILSR